MVSAGDNKTTFTVLRDGEEKEFTFTAAEYITSYITYFDSEKSFVFESDEVDGKPVGKSRDGGLKELDGDTAYIKLDQFEGNAAKELDGALAFMKERGRSKLVLDLRNNGGGSMSVLEDIASLLIDNDGKSRFTIAVAKGKEDEEVFKTGRNAYYDNVKGISVLANNRSASASECLIGAMLYYGGQFSLDRLVIEKDGDGVAKTFGKGIMQTTYMLITGGAVKLTTAQVFWPDSETCIHGKGIYPTEENAVASENAIARAVETLKGL
jgi:carboxyl-terminal processing protease